MTRRARYLAGLLVGMFALALTGAGGVAFASVPVPDPTAGSVPLPATVLSAPTTTAAASSGLSAWAILLIAACAVVVGVALTETFHSIRRHRPTGRMATV